MKQANKLMDSHEYDAAVDLLTRALTLDPDSADALNGRAWALLKLRRFSDALPDVERALVLNPGDGNTWDTRAHIMEALGRREEAVADYRRALAKSPGLKDSLLGLARLAAPAEIEVLPSTPHTSLVHSVAFSSDGKRIFSRGTDYSLKLWRADTGQLIRTFYGVTFAAFSTAGNGLLIGDGSNLSLYEADGRPVTSYIGHDRDITSAVFSPDGKVLLTAGGIARLWDATTGDIKKSFEGQFVVAVAISPDGSAAVMAGPTGNIVIRDLLSGNIRRTLSLERKDVRAVGFSRDAKHIFLNADSLVEQIDVVSGETIRSFRDLGSTSIPLSQDGARLLTGGGDEFEMWDVATGQLMKKFKGHVPVTMGLAFSPDGTNIVSGGWDKTAKLWNANTGNLIRTFGGTIVFANAVAFVPGANRIVSGSGDGAYIQSNDYTLKVWDSEDGRLVRTLDGHTGAVLSVATSRDGSRVVSGSGSGGIGQDPDNSLKVWDFKTGQVLRTIKGHTREVTAVGYSSDGRTLYSGSEDKTFRVWNADNGNLLHSFDHPFPIYAGAISNDGKLVAFGGGEPSKEGQGHLTAIISVLTIEGELVCTLQGHKERISSISISPDGNVLASAGFDATTRLWSIPHCKPTAEFNGGVQLAYSPDGRYLAIGGGSGIALLETGNHRVVRRLMGHTGSITSVAFSEDGRRVASTSRDATMKVWNVATGEALVTSVGSRDGEWLSITPVGFFAASPRGPSMLGIVKGLELTTIEQVHQSLYSPDLVREALSGDVDGEVARAAAAINLEKVLESGPPPEVKITSHMDGALTPNDVITLAANVSDKGKGIGRVEWRVNGTTVGVTSPTITTEVKLKRQIALDAGENVVEVIAYNRRNLLASTPARVKVTYNGSSDRTKPNLHVLAIGINDYRDKGGKAQSSDEPLAFGPLELAVKDAQTFGAEMARAAKGPYNSVRVNYVLDRQANRAGIEKAIAKISSELHPRDTFILFAAAHGYAVNGRFFLIPQNFQGGPNPEALAKNAISQDHLQDWLANRISAKRALILLDTCESGALVAGQVQARSETDSAVGRLHHATGRPVLTAAALGQFAKEGVLARTGERHGVFTWAILDALRKGDSNGNGLIELSEMVGHVQTLVPKLAEEMGGVARTTGGMSISSSDRQTARFGSSGGDFVIAASRR